MVMKDVCEGSRNKKSQIMLAKGDPQVLPIWSRCAIAALFGTPIQRTHTVQCRQVLPGGIIAPRPRPQKSSALTNWRTP
jgi:hypothetical protein